MSNLPSKFKDRSKRLAKGDVNKAMNMMKKPGKQVIDFSDRVLPNTMVVDIKTSTIKIGNGSDKMRDIPVWYTVNEGAWNGEQFLNILKGLTAEDINKVILDNGDGFSIKTLAEFTTDIGAYLDKMKAQIANIKVQSQDICVTQVLQI